MATSDANRAILTLHSASGVVVLFLALGALVGAAIELNEAWTWWRNGEEVSASVVWAGGDGGYQVDYDGLRANVHLDRAHEIGDVVEVRFNPAQPNKLKSESDVGKALGGGLVLLAFAAFLGSCLVADDLSQARLRKKTADVSERSASPETPTRTRCV